ncbi:DUF3592 domain-containing protein [Zavarzinia compransoris]|uniref:DUF3592 domain-containing protein n=1 Tax=Zavarzinia compransoris TaxID=1264899 RepID=A0A317E252_9PROT|nr:DUF3592 domain-containing protein [Zavarzinia compransoris]PWR20692.1 hypothetical protein DKG75_11885 [Zavarzinia compransoris]TDP44483.1 uncharacterized protein DUF3592 [Zavarzinia compransoris]
MIWIPRIFFALAALFLAVAGLAVWLSSGIGLTAKATGTVIRLETSYSNSGNTRARSTLYCPIVAFTTATGQRIELDRGFCSSPAVYDVGESVEVSYDPDDPADAVYGGFFTRYLVAVIFGAFGTLLLIGASIAWILVRKAARPVREVMPLR